MIKIENKMRTIIISISFLIMGICFYSCSEKSVSINNEYLGAEIPGLIPVLFGENLATNNDNRHSALTFSPDGKEMYYSVYQNRSHPQKIFYTTLKNGNWTTPELASFSGKHKDGAPLFSPDGKRLYFHSKRPLEGDTLMNESYDIWYVEKTDSIWGEAKRLAKPVNSVHNEVPKRFTKSGHFIFRRQTEDKKNYLLISQYENGMFGTPDTIKETMNDDEFFKPSPVNGEDFFIYERNVKKGRFYYSYLYISYKNEDGSWTTPKNMGDMINNGEGRFPSFSPDGKYMFFISYRTGMSQYYWVDAKIIDYLKTENLDLADQLNKIMLEKGLNEFKLAYNNVKTKHADYYVFDELLLNNIAKMLIDKDSLNKAIQVYNMNFVNYPALEFYPQKLAVALLTNNNEKFAALSSKILSDSLLNKDEMLEKLHAVGDMFLNKNKVDLALKIFELNAKLNPTSTWPYYELGTAYYKLDDFEEARKYFNKSFQLDSSNWATKNYLKELNLKN